MNNLTFYQFLWLIHDKNQLIWCCAMPDDKKNILEKLQDSVPFPNGHGVFLLKEYNNINKKYLTDTSVEDRCMFLLISLGCGILYNFDIGNEGAYRTPQNLLVEHWLSNTAEWLSIHGFDICRDNIETIINELFLCVKKSTKYNNQQLLTKAKYLQSELFDQINEKLPDDINQLPLLSKGNFFNREIISESDNLNLHPNWLKKNIGIDNDNYGELYFWVRLESLLGLRLIFNKRFNNQTIEEVLKFQKNSYIDDMKEFFDRYPDVKLKYNNQFFVFIDTEIKNYKLTPKVKDFLKDVSFMTISQPTNTLEHKEELYWFWNADFKSFLYSLKLHNPNAYQVFTKYENAATTLAYAIIDHFMYNKPLNDTNANSWWQKEEHRLRKHLLSEHTPSQSLAEPPFCRETMANMVHNLKQYKSPQYHYFYQIVANKEGNVVLDTRAYMLKRC